MGRIPLARQVPAVRAATSLDGNRGQLVGTTATAAEFRAGGLGLLDEDLQHCALSRRCEVSWPNSETQRAKLEFAKDRRGTRSGQRIERGEHRLRPTRWQWPELPRLVRWVFQQPLRNGRRKVVRVIKGSSSAFHRRPELDGTRSCRTLRQHRSHTRKSCGAAQELGALRDGAVMISRSHRAPYNHRVYRRLLLSAAYGAARSPAFNARAAATHRLERCRGLR